MDATTMPSTPSLLARLKGDYPQFQFTSADDFLWSPSEQTIYYGALPTGDSFLLHELSHGILNHSGYRRDIELIAMERAAWDQASLLAPQYDRILDLELIEDTLDTYRDWLHARSSCPKCDATGLQTKKDTYHCPACNHGWRVNEARVCALRRFNT